MNDKIRLEILKFYYAEYKKDPIKTERYGHFMKIFNLTENELIGHVRYLHDKQLLECICSRGTQEFGKPIYCKITAYGIDAIEHPDQFASKVPFLNLIIHGNVTNSTIMQAENIRIENGFNSVHNAIKDSNLDAESKKELADNVKELELESKKEEPSLSRIQYLFGKVKKISIPIYVLLEPIIQEYIKQRVLPPTP
jgi:hypothetical protein